VNTVTSTVAGRFGAYGAAMFRDPDGRSGELDQAYAEAQADPVFHAELDMLLADYAGRPTPLYLASRLTSQLGGAKIYLNGRICCTPAPTRSTTALARVCWRGYGPSIVSCRDRSRPAWRSYRNRVRTVRHGVRGLHGEEDMRRQELNVYRMRMLGAEVRASVPAPAP